MRRTAVLVGVTAGLLLLGAFAPSNTTSPDVTETSFAVSTSLDPDNPGYVLTEPVPGRGDFVGVTWSSGSPDTVEIRALEDQTWTEWRDILTEPGHAPDAGTPESGGTAGGSDPTMYSDPEAVQVRISGETPNGLAITFIDSSVSSPGLSTASAVAGLPIQPRSAWDPGNRCSPRVESEEIQVDVAIVHHTGIDRMYSSSEVPGIILSYCLYHRNGRGWDDLAYNFMIDRFGVIWEGRAGGIEKGIRGGHTKGVNSFTTGIALIGNFIGAPPSSAQQQALTDLLAWKFGLHNIDPLGKVEMITEGSRKFAENERITLDTIAGHSDAQATVGPGFYLYNLLPKIRKDVAAAISTTPISTYGPPVTGDFTGDGVEDGAVYVPASKKWMITSGKTGANVNWSSSAGPNALVDAATADLNGDTKADIVGVAPGTFTTYRSTGSGFVSSTVTGVADPRRVIQVDDGTDQTSIITDGNGRVRVAPTWSTIGTAPGMTDVTTADLTGDGVDAVVTVAGQGKIAVYALGNEAVDNATINVSGADRIVAGDFDGSGVETVAAIDSESGIVTQIAWNGSKLVVKSMVDLDSLDHIGEAFASTTADGTRLIVLDGNVGVWKSVLFDGTLSGYTILEDQPYRTYVSRREPTTDKPFLSYFAREFGWMQMTQGRQQNPESNPGIRVIGASRYQTNTLLTQATYARSDEVVIATGTGFADALAAGAVAASRDAVLLLSDPNTLPGNIATEIRRLGATRAIVAGGPDAIDEDVVTSLKSLGLTVERVGGVDRFETAVLLSRTTFDSATKTVYIATGLNYPDALASVPLAASTRSPVLLVGKDLTPSVAAEIRRLNPDRIVVLGGTAAVDSKVEAQIAALTQATMARIAGADRYGTSVLMSRNTFKGTADTVYLTIGTNFPDALMAGPVAAVSDSPILLTNPSMLPPGVYQEIIRLKAKRVIVLGSTNTISEEIFHELRGLGPSLDTQIIRNLPRP